MTVSIQAVVMRCSDLSFWSILVILPYLSLPFLKYIVPMKEYDGET